MYRDGKHGEALDLYTESLAVAKTKAQKIALHSNRAACYLKLQDFKKAAEECTSVLELDYQHTGALMLRAQTLVTVKDYQSALFDVNRLMELNPLSDVYRDLQARLKTQLALAPIPESEEEALNIEGEGEEEKVEEDRDMLEQQDQRQEDKSAPKEGDKTIEPPSINHIKPNIAQNQNQSPNTEASSDVHSKGWEAIPKPKGHSRLDYSQWDRVDDDSSEDDDDEDEQQQPQYRFRVRTVGVRPVK